MLTRCPNIFRRLLRSSPSITARGGERLLSSLFYQHESLYSTHTETLTENDRNRKNGKWFILPPFAHTVNLSALGKELTGGGCESNSDADSKMTAVKWTLRCCPELPRSLVQKLFRLRQVRREPLAIEVSDNATDVQKGQLKRVAAKDSLNIGDRIYLPGSVQQFPMKKQECHCNEEEVKFIRGLVLYKDSSIVVINKPPGMPVQGGIGIKRSLDELAATCLTFDYAEPPRLVHRLDRDCSGLLVLGRTQTSAAVLHSIFREKTFDASKEDSNKRKRILQRRYWALVIGSPRLSKGLISAPLGKVVVNNGKSDRITVVDNAQVASSQHAITEYRVIKSSSGYTWLELFPLTGRKHQLRVHCAEVLGTPIVGDYKYGWQAHRNWKHLSDLKGSSDEGFPKDKTLPFGLDLEGGSITGLHVMTIHHLSSASSGSSRHCS
ncbi:RNA pseudouridine synthase 4, mitochondrial isoform X2 [Carica papaya]|uniref:RNA pseudouridine synthase 4, mitochondrial isoform X2 n=1 Tax=Carica papaya TaxID=3649 RepID=UPI000B8C7DDB|nr:RNA pseudouridine synthase 4, mitochondrial isoform X2 [Carica papaya]XP_021892318.1 RNA pseudouridine synthase 4, mitochondrial isoform X2 [Carica papaya]